jgi:2-hydroxychromene-2-carboxylate isomerase
LSSVTPMPAMVEFYFDFLSPYAYLGSVGIERLANELNFKVAWRPLLLGITVVKVMGLKGVAEIPLKREYVRRDVERFASYLDIPFSRASTETMKPLSAMRAFVWLDRKDPNKARAFARSVFDAQWAQARDMSSVEAVVSLAGMLDEDPDEMRCAIQDPAIKRLLAERVEKAIERGVFGTPTFAVGEELFWGADRLPMLKQWLESGGW